MTVQEYHKLPFLSASRMKVFLSDRHKFKKYYVDFEKEPVKKHTGSTLLGDLVDFFLLRDIENGGVEYFDDVYSRYQGKMPTPQFKEFTDLLYENTIEASNDEGVQTKSFEELLKETFEEFAYKEGERVKFKLKKYNNYENFVVDFHTNCFEYYKALRDTTDKSIVTLSEVEAARKVVKKATESWVTRKFFMLRSSSEIKVIKQLPVIFQFEGETLKGLIDYVLIDHHKKLIYPYDLKTLYRQSEFQNNFFRFGYWIAIALYTTGLKVWAEENGMKDYTVKPLGFLRVSTSFFEAPLITLTRDEQYVKCMDGFDGRKGLIEIVQDIRYHKEKGFWDMTVEDHKKNGITIIDFI